MHRIIFIVAIFSKIFAFLMYRQHSFYFKNSNLIFEPQLGFYDGRSTTNAVMKVENHTLNALDDKESVALTLMDLSKGFDCVPFNTILQKLELYGVITLM